MQAALNVSLTTDAKLHHGEYGIYSTCQTLNEVNWASIAAKH